MYYVDSMTDEERKAQQKIWDSAILITTNNTKPIYIKDGKIWEQTN